MKLLGRKMPQPGQVTMDSSASCFATKGCDDNEVARR
jgi:hypothetical protein